MNLGGHYKMSDELRAALERARDHVMTPEEKFEQRVSFIYGMQDFDNPNPRSKDEIRAWVIEHHGYPPCPKCAAQGTEAQRAEIVKQGSVHDGPVVADDAPITGMGKSDQEGA